MAAARTKPSGLPRRARGRSSRRPSRRQASPHIRRALLPPARRREHPDGRHHHRSPRARAGGPRRTGPARRCRRQRAHIQGHLAAIAPEEHAPPKALSDADPASILAVAADLEPAAPQDSEPTYLHGVAATAQSEVPHDLDVIRVDVVTWAAFSSRGPFPDALQRAWAAKETEWFPSNPRGWGQARRSCATSSPLRPTQRASSGCPSSGRKSRGGAAH